MRLTTILYGICTKHQPPLLLKCVAILIRNIFVTRSDKIGLIAEKYTHVHIMVYIISSVGAIEILFVL